MYRQVLGYRLHISTNKGPAERTSGAQSCIVFECLTNDRQALAARVGASKPGQPRGILQRHEKCQQQRGCHGCPRVICRLARCRKLEAFTAEITYDSARDPNRRCISFDGEGGVAQGRPASRNECHQRVHGCRGYAVLAKRFQLAGRECSTGVKSNSHTSLSALYQRDGCWANLAIGNAEPQQLCAQPGSLRCHRAGFNLPRQSTRAVA